MHLNAAQRECIRSVGDIHGVTGHDKATVDAVVKLGFVWYDGDRGEHHLTAKGAKEYRRIMRSGDGPEALKDLFR